MQVPPPQVPPYTDAPPAYSEIYQPRYMHPPQVTGQLPPITTAYPASQMFVPMPQTVPVGAMTPNVPMGYYPMGPVYPPGSTVLVEGGFDAGARFGPGTASIPPPPPGHAPNAAQLAAMQGANVVMTQRKSNFFMGGSGGGYTIW
ncbi:DAZ-associated protein 2 isoform X2 [Ictalurus punctatus]|nr:DAZ-associated protein 2 isoform X2 [Ictalurus punctatus]